jgi:hypothetical protein
MKNVWNSSDGLEKKSGIPASSMKNVWNSSDGLEKSMEFQAKKGEKKAGIPTPSIGGILYFLE